MLSNTELLDKLTRRGLELIRLSNGEGRTATIAIKRMMRAIIAEAATTRLGTRGTKALIKRMRELVTETYGQLAESHKRLIAEISRKESAYIARSLRMPNSARVGEVNPLGLTVDESAKAQAQRLIDRLTAEIRNAQIVEGNPIEAMREAETAAVASVVGAVDAVIMAAAQEVRTSAFEQNNVEGLRWLAILDGRTCPACGQRSNRIYSTDYKPLGHEIEMLRKPPMHPRCRCSLVPVTAPFDDLPTFDEFLQRQGSAKREEILGKGRAELYERGVITLNDLVSQSGRVVSLKDLRE